MGLRNVYPYSLAQIMTQTPIPNTARLGVIAGGGALPGLLADACAAAGTPVTMVGLEGQADESLRPRCALWARLGAAGAILGALKDSGARDLVLIGSVRRPSLAELRPDWAALRILGRVGLGSGGDDALLRALRAALEDQGFTLHPVQAFLPCLLAPTGPLTRRAPDEAQSADIARGVEVARALGALDVGQAAVVQGGIVLGVEGAEGTAALIARCKGLARRGPSGVLVKLAKPGQDRALDLPTIGLGTVASAVESGLSGIAVEAGGVLIADRNAATRAADDAGLFITGVAP